MTRNIERQTERHRAGTASFLWISIIAVTATGCDDAANQSVKQNTTHDGTDAGQQTTALTSAGSTSVHEATSTNHSTNAPESFVDDAHVDAFDTTADATDYHDATTADADAADGDITDPSDAAGRDAGLDSVTEATAAPDSGSPSDLLEQARAEYRAWEPRTQQPVPISSEIFGLCRLPNEAESAFVESVHGGELALQDWLNPAAREGVATLEASSGNDEPLTFAVGSTIVKEKMAWREGAWELAALGLMIKREPGFDPSHGDWLFGYWDPALGMEFGSEAQASCGECHALSGTDFVYADDSWRR